MSHPFIPGTEYTRADVYRLLDVPTHLQRGNWETGYNRYENNLYIFCNVGVKGRTDHDYDNHWEGDDFVWFAKTGTKLRQPQIQWMLNPTGKIFLFTRSVERGAFTFWGTVIAKNSEDSSPVKITWRVEERFLIAVDIEPVPADRTETTISRIIRDTALAKRIKELHGNRCQICGEALKLSDGTFYSEAHHLQPLGSPHDGPDVEGNILVVCPNHHALCDFGAIHLDIETLRRHPLHEIGPQFVSYHNATIAHRSSR
ncbi:DUF3427 domain-containing protein [Bremerella sp. P1]|uniref:DUF3427 domain-containing protein n=1 Tax=Bremerella sp. P1 TaxID=3026424 RepID=UPI0023686CB4|nr:DUF3427 domain-containing protein [Bremerella sp. P1]WDI40220.1 DUF3427 domain-containing protein [Bremerella sp. P1]